MLKDIKLYMEKYSEISEDYKERVRSLYNNLTKKDLIKLKDYLQYILSLKYKTRRFIFYMNPKATPRARRGIHGIFYVGDASFNFELFKEYIDSREDIEVIKTPTKLIVNAYLEMSIKDRVEMLLAELGLIPPISIPDVDNLVKTYMDMTQKTLLLNDSLIYDLRIRKYYSTKPRIDITFCYLESYGSKYNKNKIENWKAYKEYLSKSKKKGGDIDV